MKINGMCVPKANPGLLISVCCVCERIGNTKPSFSGKEVFKSHGYCPDCVKEIKYPERK